MHKLTLALLFTFLFSIFHADVFGQAPFLGAASTFSVFTAVGAFDNLGTTTIVGDIGTNSGVFSGFPPGIVVGQIHVADAVSTQAATDALAAYSFLSGVTCGVVLGTGLGNGQVLAPNVYCLGAAATLNGTLTLDAQGISDAIFIFQIDGALATGILSNVILINGASTCNVFWQINGAVSLGNSSVFRGTALINGAISVLEDATVVGRLLSTSGAVDLHNNNVSISLPPVCAISGNTSICAGLSTQLCATLGFANYLWSTGEITNCITVNAGGTYSVTITDANGCTSFCSQNVQENPASSCTITGNDIFCAGQSTQLCVPAGAAAYLWNTGATSNCISANTAGTFSVTVTAVGGCTSTCQKTILVGDLPLCEITGDEFICGGQTAQLCAAAGAASYIWSTGATTQCLQIIEAGTYSVTVTGANGCTNFCMESVISDQILPEINCPIDVSIDCAASILPTNTGVPTATDNCAPPPSLTFLDQNMAGNCPQNRTITRIWTATDLEMNTATCAQKLTIRDQIAPQISCPPNITIDCSASILPINTGSPTATDNCDNALIFSSLDQNTAGICPQEFTISRRWTATDACGNSAFCDQQITVEDNALPTIICPQNLTFQCQSDVPAADASLALATDFCGGTATVSSVSEVVTNFICANRFSLNRTFRATDACGNSAFCTQIITVFDSTPPTIIFNNPLLTNGGTLEVACFGQTPSWQIPTFSASDITATDNCGGDVAVVFTKNLEAEGNCRTDGFIVKYRLSWTATDVCGNVSTVFIFQKLVDNTPPVLVGIPNDLTVNCGEIPPAPLQIAATDECLCACVMVFDEILPASGCQNGQIITRIWTATDNCGNESTAAQRITLIDNSAPALMLVGGFPNDTMLNFTCANGGFPSFLDTFNAQSVVDTSACGGSFSIDFNQENLVADYCKTAGFLEQKTFTWTATDLCGNASKFSFVARLIDTEKPILTGVPARSCLTDPLLDLIEITDNCGAPTLEFQDLQILNPCGLGMATRRIYEAFDDCGNVARDTAILFPNTGAAPIISFANPAFAAMQTGEILTIDCAASGAQFTKFSAADVAVQTVCQLGATVVFSEKITALGDCLTDGYLALLKLEWTATDFCGQVSKLVLLAKVVDELSPVFPNFESEIFLACGAIIPKTEATDNCGNVAVLTFDSLVLGNCAFEYTVFRQISATDNCGNSVQKQQIIHVGNINGPTINGVKSVVCDDLSLPVVTAFDACAGKFVPVKMRQDTLISLCQEGFVIERIWSATDSCGTVSESRQLLILNDQTPPKIRVPLAGDIGQFLSNKCTQIASTQTDLWVQLSNLNAFSVEVEDDCDEAIIPVFTVDTSRSADCKLSDFFEKRTYKWTATDACGNAATVSFCVEMLDNLPPIFSVVLAVDSVVCAAMPPVPEVVVIDNLSAVTVVFSETILPGDAAGIFFVVRRWTATDACGNVAIYTQRIVWIPDTFLACAIVPPPAVECNSHGVMIGGMATGGLGSLVYLWEVVGEKCGIQSGQGTPNIKIYVGFSGVKVKLTVTDRFGCQSMCMTTLGCFLAAKNAQFGDADANSWAAADVNLRAESGKIWQNSFKIWPNPAHDLLNFRFKSVEELKTEISLSDLLGHVVFSKIYWTTKGINEQTIDLSKIRDGSYQLRLKTTAEMHTKGVIILRND